MQSHTCMASGSLSFRCDLIPLEVVGSRTLSCLVHRRPLPAFVGLGYYRYGLEGNGSSHMKRESDQTSTIQCKGERKNFVYFLKKKS